ncbi:hypothetical protein KBC86_00195 [Candidatus Gracilibacteria bacterium]|nr:hypothetical protein [Candidatus Gracilibacteria bacterium]
MDKPDMSKVNPTLKNVIEQNLYKPSSTYGNGSLADAIRYEKATGIPVEGRWHTQAGEDARNSLIGNYNSFNADEKKIADAIFNDISNALNGK